MSVATYGPYQAIAIRVWVGLSIVLFSMGFAHTTAQAHELRPAVLALRESAPGTFQVRFSPVQTNFGTSLEIEPLFPAHCQFRATRHELDCGNAGLVGDIEFPGLEDTNYRVVVRIQWANGLESVTSVGASRSNSGAEPSGAARLSVRGWSSEASLHDRLRLLWDYGVLGVFHILSGLDHVAFVLGLLLLSGATRALVWTISAFTAAHSLTLAAALLGWANVPAPPVEAAIALSILLVAWECTHARPTLARRAPWLVALSFGLLHGLGFAGALGDVGLPPHQRGLALLGFNLGVELGQLAIIAPALLLRRWLTQPRFKRTAVYALGTAAALWTIERCWALFVT